MKKILIIAGEASSDMHAANLVRDINSLDASISFFGLGGDRMRHSGVKLLNNIVHLAFIGPGGLFRNYKHLRKIFYSLCSYITNNPPDCAILIDYAEFNLRVAKKLKSLGVPVIYYISPQVWAWGLWRIKTIKRLADKMLVLLKFEEDLYKNYGVDAVFVGHPLLDIAKTTDPKADILKNLNLSQDTKVVGVLPGSRKSEIRNILPIMLKSCRLMLEGLKPLIKVEFILPLAPTIEGSIEESWVKEMVDRSSLKIKVVKDYTYNALSICHCAMVASGTATLETALLGVPMAIIYKVNLLTYLITKNVIKLPYIGLVNVVGGEKIVPEFLQREAGPEKISQYLIGLLKDKNLTDSIKERFTKIRASLGEPGASKRAAREVVNFLTYKRQTAGA